MLTSILLSNNPIIFWFGIALLTTTVVPLVIEIMGVHYSGLKIMTITKEQFELFNNNFEVIEITNDVSEYKAVFNHQDIIKQEDSPGESFLDVNWNLKYSEPFESQGYSIISKYPETHITFVSGLEDIQNFIKNDMGSYLKLKGN